MAVVRPLAEESENNPGARAVIEARPNGEWALIHDSDEVGTFDTFEDAAARAVEEFGVGSYLIRTGAVATVTLPSSVVLQRAGGRHETHGSRRAARTSLHPRVSQSS
jgi:hypothetical protein